MSCLGVSVVGIKLYTKANVTRSASRARVGYPMLSRTTTEAAEKDIGPSEESEEEDIAGVRRSSSKLEVLLCCSFPGSE